MFCDWCLADMVYVMGDDYDYYYYCPVCKEKTPLHPINTYEKEDEEVYFHGRGF